MQRLLEEEDAKLKGKLPKSVTPGKITRAQIEETIRKDQQQKENGDEGLQLPHHYTIERPLLARGFSMPRRWAAQAS